jgi:hypothetical protein
MHINIWIIVNVVFLVIAGGSLGILVSIILNPDKADYWAYLVVRVLRWFGIRREKTEIAREIDYKITSIAKSINAQAEGVLPYGIRVKWVSEQTGIAFLKDGDVVVKLRKHENQDKNIVDAILLYIPRAVLPRARPYININVLKAVDLTVARKILHGGHQDSSLDYFVDTVFNPVCQQNIDTKRYCRLINDLDEHGLFTRILLREFLQLGGKLSGFPVDQTYWQDSIQFVEFLHDLATRSPQQIVPLTYRGQKIRIGIILIARFATVRLFGLSKHLEHVNKRIIEGVDSIYLFAFEFLKYETVTDDQDHVVNVLPKKSFEYIQTMERYLGKDPRLLKISKNVYISKDPLKNVRKAMCISYKVVKPGVKAGNLYLDVDESG